MSLIPIDQTFRFQFKTFIHIKPALDFILVYTCVTSTMFIDDNVYDIYAIHG